MDLFLVPVVRAQDLAFTGKGTIYLIQPSSSALENTNDKNSNISFTLYGSNTAFLTELHPKSSITLPSKMGVAEVEKVISDTEVILKTPFDSKSSIWESALYSKEGVTGWKITPHVDQGDLYQSVWERLQAGGCIGIFPEGGKVNILFSFSNVSIKFYVTLNISFWFWRNLKIKFIFFF